jgi:hypothetical protein
MLVEYLGFFAESYRRRGLFNRHLPQTRTNAVIGQAIDK